VVNRRLALLAAAALAGCEVYAVPDPPTCPGATVGTLDFSGALLPASCPFAGSANATLTFSGTLTVEADGTAWLCVNAPHAEPRKGTLVGDAVDVSYRYGTSFAECTCAVEVVETITGALQRGTGGKLTGFTGGMTTAVSPAAASPPSTADGGVCGCQLPCALPYDLTAQAIEAR
jgi:hypothetical protein